MNPQDPYMLLNGVSVSNDIRSDYHAMMKHLLLTDDDDPIEIEQDGQQSLQSQQQPLQESLGKQDQEQKQNEQQQQQSEIEMMMMKAMQCKDRGNDECQSGQYARSLDYYHQSLQILMQMGSVSADQHEINSNDRQTDDGDHGGDRRVRDSVRQQDVRELTLGLHLNLSFICLQMSRYQDALDHAGKALEIDPMSPKALYRHGIALSKLDIRLHDAIENLRIVADILPYNPAVQEELQHLRVRIARRPDASAGADVAASPAPAKIDDDDGSCNLCRIHGSIRGCNRSCKIVNGRPVCWQSASISPPHQYLFTKCEVRKHTTIDDCWLIKQNSIIQAASFIKEHPGGQRCILKRAGFTDCTEDYDFHGNKGKKIWDSLKIGTMVKCDSSIPHESASAAASTSERAKHATGKDEGKSISICTIL